MDCFWLCFLHRWRFRTQGVHTYSQLVPTQGAATPPKVQGDETCINIQVMHVKVLPMRRHGRRLKHSDWVNQPVVEGDLSMAELSTRHGHVKFASLTDTGVGLRTRL